MIHKAPLMMAAKGPKIFDEKYIKIYDAYLCLFEKIFVSEVFINYLIFLSSLFWGSYHSKVSKTRLNTAPPSFYLILCPALFNIPPFEILIIPQ